MFVNRLKINVSTFNDTVSAATIDIPLSMEYQLVDQAELINRVFVDVETERAINKIIDYEKARFLPLNLSNELINKITYVLDLSGLTTYGSIGFTDDDIKFKKEVFKQTFLNLEFYDTDNPLTQILVSRITLFSELKNDDLISSNINGIIGQPKPANQIPLTFVLENEIFNNNGYSEGFYLYDYKDEVKINEYKYLYMRASFKNAKTGKSINMMVKNSALPIDYLIHELYTRYKLIRNNNGFYYIIDDTYQGNSINSGSTNNVSFSSIPPLNSVQINLYQINAT